MALNQVGTASPAYIENATSLTVTFVADNAFREGDLLAFVMLYSSMLSGGSFTAPSGWLGTSDANFTSEMPFGSRARLWRHIVTAAEAGETFIEQVFTGSGIGTPDWACLGGVAIRGGNDSVSVGYFDENQTVVDDISPDTATIAQNGAGDAHRLVLYYVMAGTNPTATMAVELTATDPVGLTTNLFVDQSIPVTLASAAGYVWKGYWHHMTDEVEDIPGGTATFTYDNDSDPSWGHGVTIALGVCTFLNGIEPETALAETIGGMYIEGGARRVSIQELPYQVQSDMMSDLEF